MSLAASTRLGPYEVLGLIGAGGMGEVYRARDTRLDRTVAIKILPAAISSDSDRRARFEREAKSIAGLAHPHICTLYDVGEDAGAMFLVMEHLEGETLAHRLEKGRLPIEQALTIGIEVADALSTAHRHGIVHRDLKPANVMLTDTGVKLLDFGLAKLKPGQDEAGAGVSSVTREAPLTGDRQLLGTVPYMAPEQLEGKAVDARSDVFALGCVIYEMLTGRRAFEGESHASVISAIMMREPPPVSSLQPLTPPLVDRLVQTCLAKKPEQRWDSAHDVAEQLRAIAEARGPASAVAPRGTWWTWHRRESHQWPLALLGGAAIVVTLGTIFTLRPDRQTPARVPAAPSHARSAIAVLPFQNLSADGPNAYFAGGLHDELLTQLAKVASLKVISRTSVMGYQGTTKPLTQIADELGVGSIVEGTVQVVGGRLRVNVQLIDAVTDQHLWADRYDRALDDAFAIQSEVAQRVVAAVGAALSSDERDGIAAAPTSNAEAYRLYLQGRECFRRPGYRRSDLDSAQHFYEQALDLDPSFALAHAALSLVHGKMYHLQYDPSAARAARQREEAETALRLSPDLPQAHHAMGCAHYFGRRDYRRALDELDIALQNLPNDVEILGFLGYVHRRRGDWDEVLAVFEKAIQLNPRDADLFWDLGGFTYQIVRRYPEAVRAYDRALSLAPDLRVAAVFRGWTYARWQGRLDVLEEALTRATGDAEIGPQGTAEAQRAALLLWERNADLLLQALERTQVVVFVGLWHYLPTALYTAWGRELRGEVAGARAAFDAARVSLDAATKERPDDWRVHAARGLALAGLGHRDEALREARWLQESGVYRTDAFDGPLLAEDRARILARAGDTEAALDEVERLLARPSWLSVHTLRLDPRWDSIRNHPRFKDLLARYGAAEVR